MNDKEYPFQNSFLERILIGEIIVYENIQLLPMYETLIKSSLSLEESIATVTNINGNIKLITNGTNKIIIPFNSPLSSSSKNEKKVVITHEKCCEDLNGDTDPGWALKFSEGGFIKRMYFHGKWREGILNIWLVLLRTSVIPERDSFMWKEKNEMKKIYLLWGATTTGKTTCSVTLAKKFKIPAISLDRFQGYTEILTGSGAPTPFELQGTTRIYISPSRKLSERVISAEEFHLDLKKVTSSLVNVSSIIIEGGSVSILKEMMKDAYWSEFLWSIRIFTPPSREVFIEKAKKRVFDMIHPLYGRPYIVEEINLFFNFYQTVNPLKDVDGYREIIDYYEKTVSYLMGNII